MQPAQPGLTWDAGALAGARRATRRLLPLCSGGSYEVSWQRSQQWWSPSRRQRRRQMMRGVLRLAKSGCTARWKRPARRRRASGARGSRHPPAAAAARRLLVPRRRGRCRCCRGWRRRRVRQRFRPELPRVATGLHGSLHAHPGSCAAGPWKTLWRHKSGGSLASTQRTAMRQQWARKMATGAPIGATLVARGAQRLLTLQPRPGAAGCVERAAAGARAAAGSKRRRRTARARQRSVGARCTAGRAPAVRRRRVHTPLLTAAPSRSMCTGPAVCGAGLSLLPEGMPGPAAGTRPGPCCGGLLRCTRLRGRGTPHACGGQALTASPRYAARAARPHLQRRRWRPGACDDDWVRVTALARADGSAGQ